MAAAVSRKEARVRAAALHLVRRGSLRPHEIAGGLGISPQLLRHWIRESGIDWKHLRAIFVQRCIDRALSRGL